MQNFALKIVSMLIGILLPQVTPLIKEELYKFLQFIYGKAKETPNPVDDALVGILLEIFQVDTPQLDSVPPPVVRENVDYFSGLANVTNQ